jgi:hypothetical protein
MTHIRRISPVLFLLLAAAGAFAQSKGAQAVTVSNAKELLLAIAPDRTIVLKKGDYVLRSAYGTTSKYATWVDGDDGKELSLSKLANLTIRGDDGARIVSDSGLSSILGIYDSTNVTLDNIVFSRAAKSGSDVGAGSLYAESVKGLVVDRCAFEGDTTTAIELWECEGVSIKRSAVSDATSGAISASYTHDLVVSSSKVTGCEGYPLLYLEESDKVLFESTSFEGATGGNFIEIYAESGSVESVRFEDCVFKGNKVDYFSGSQLLPATDACRFDGNSFGEDWATASVAPASDEKYYSDEEADGAQADDSSADETPADETPAGPIWYEHASGLSFSYPSEWEMNEYKAETRVGVFAPDGKSLAFFLTAYKVPANVDPAKQGKKVFADSAAALVKLLKDKAGISLVLQADGESYTDNDLLSADYKGTATKGDGEKAVARVRFVVTQKSVDAMVGLAADSSSLDPDGEMDGIFASIEITAGGGD